jgi:hypothetical protein
MSAVAAVTMLHCSGAGHGPRRSGNRLRQHAVHVLGIFVDCVRYGANPQSGASETKWSDVINVSTNARCS